VPALFEEVGALEQPDKKLLADHLDWRNPDFRSGFMTAPKAQDDVQAAEGNIEK